MNNQHRTTPIDRIDLPRTVIPAPRDAAIFPGWGVKF
jgi:hypothetical protein